jgi:hypothetical protein
MPKSAHNDSNNSLSRESMLTVIDTCPIVTHHLFVLLSYKKMMSFQKTDMEKAHYKYVYSKLRICRTERKHDSGRCPS